MLHYQELLDDLSELITNENSSKMLVLSRTPPRARVLKKIYKVIDFQSKLQVDNKKILIILHKTAKDATDRKETEFCNFIRSRVEHL